MSSVFKRKFAPVMWEREICSVPLIFTDNVGYGFYTYNKTPIGRNQPSLKWITFHYAAGFVIYGSNESFGVAIIKGNAALYSIADIGFEEAFDVSDINEFQVRVTNVNVNLANTDIIVTLVCNYGSNILEASYSIKIKSILFSSSSGFSHPGDAETTHDEIWDNYTGTYGLTKIRNSVLDTSRSDINKDMIDAHIQALNAFDCNISDTDIYDLCVFTVEDKNFLVTISDNKITVYDDLMTEIVSETLEKGNELSERNNFMTTFVKAVPLCKKTFSQRYYSIEVPNGVYRRFRNIERVTVQTYSDGKIRNYDIIVSIDDLDELTFTIEESLIEEVSRDDAEYMFFSKRIIINAEELLFKFLDTNLALDDSLPGEEAITGINSVVPYVEYQ